MRRLGMSIFGPIWRSTAAAVLCLVFGLANGSAGAEERWEHIGDMEATASKPPGQLSLNLDSLRRRAGHYEIWERIVYVDDPLWRPKPGVELPAEHRTLWAVRCRAGELAKITEGDAGSLEPRAEQLRFYSPLPYSAGGAVIEIVCREARRLAAAKKAAPADGAGQEPAGEKAPPARGLEQPPSISDLDNLDDDVD
jgi:hypothetical protein